MKSLSVIFVLVAALACTRSPLGRKQLHLVADAQMEELGQQAFQEIKQNQKISNDENKIAYVNCVASHLISEVEGTEFSQWETQVFEDKSPNAFALPGRKIGVHTGMLTLAENQDQLAAVVAHEIAHVLARHGSERVSQSMAIQGAVGLTGQVLDIKGPKGEVLMAALGLGAQFGILLPYSRAQETESDLIGLQLMAKAGFKPTAAIQLWKNMSQYGNGQQPPEFLSTHPSHQTRIEDLIAHMPEAIEIFQEASDNKKPSCQRS